MLEVGTTKQIIHKKINRRIRIGAFVISPLVIIGVASIIFQLSSGKSGEYTLFDFNLGKLWSWAISSDEPEKTVSKPFEFNQSIPVAEIENGALIPQLNVKELLKTQPREVNTMQNEFNQSNIEALNVFKPVELVGVTPVKGYISTLSERFFVPMEKEFLFASDIQIKKSKIAVGASFAPGISFRKFGYNNLSSIGRIDNGTVYTYGQSREYRKKNDQAVMNFYSGLDIYFNLNEKWTIQSGLYYTSMGEKLQVVKHDFSGSSQVVTAPESSPFESKKAIFDSPEMVEYDEQQKIPFSNSFGMFELPIILNYNAHNFNDQLSVQLQGGLSYSRLDQADFVLYDYETNQYYWINHSDFELLNRNFISGIAGIAVSQYISKEIEFFANPQFKYAFTPTFSEKYEIDQHQWAIGLRLGMKVHL